MENTWFINEDKKDLTHLVILLDSSAPSVCFYETDKKQGKPKIMSYDVLKDVVKYAREHDLFLNIIYGKNKVPTEIEELIESTHHAKIVPFTLLSVYPESIPVLQYTSKGIDDSLLPEEGIDNIIVRVSKSNFSHFSKEVHKLVGRVKRINLILSKLNDYSEKDVQSYKRALDKIADIIAQACSTGSVMEFSSITDRIVLENMRNCDGGVTNLTVSPEGDWFICPGFYYSNSESFGNLKEKVIIKNYHLYDQKYAPICKQCDCYHCKRCVYLNYVMTMEANTPSHIQCVTSHKERETSRNLLQSMQDMGLLLEMNSIPYLDYEDPIEVVTGKKRKISLTEYMLEASQIIQDVFEVNEEEVAPTKEEIIPSGIPGNPNMRRVGKVSEEEKNEIKSLFERRISLEELFHSLLKLDEKELRESALYDRIISDLNKVKSDYNHWWEEKAHQYQWEKGDKGQFSINFDSCEVFGTNVI